ncbi:hypothetical protein HYH02_004901 [Chlamydomonas schloesseri]|uniref:Uncharacterized protein n=1 Tax=Chlamydomonas schloesseri TaxID=2026947 RepID=A0A836B884_9CHLO|nr:hypothetical protein HYH02_004901 [Chlamydomonas schloesseri]|eukprot:KAG2450398.1 hypothetical protein HYH02_004901 [Chlamydomonas schloesseri]
MSAGSQLFDLESNAPKLRLRDWKDKDGKPTEQVWEVSFPDGRPAEIYLDAKSCQAVHRIRSWAATRCRRAGQKWRISALPALVVSGLIKTGKSYTLNEVVAAVLAEALAREPPGHRLKGIRVLRLNCMDLQRRNGAGALMYDLLSVIVKWAVKADVRVNDAEWREAQEVLADGPNGIAMDTRAGRAVAELFERGFQTPVLVLMDELQALLQPTTYDNAGGQEQLLAWGEFAFIRDVVLRRILINAPPHVLWAFTGSSMALVWMSLVAMPVNGTAPLNQIKTVHLPASVPPHLMHELVVHRLQQLGLSEPQMQELEHQQQAVGQAEHQQQAVGQAEHQQQAVGQAEHQQQAVGQFKTLLERSGNSPALFTTMLELWADEETSAVEITTFVDEFMKNKLFEEAVKEWNVALAHMPDKDRRRVLDLANVVLGAQIFEFPSRGIWRFLEPYMLKTEHGRYYLADPMQRLLLRAVIDRGGKLRTSFTGLGEGLTLVQLEWGWLLLQLGEVADYLAGQRRPPKGFPSHVEGATELTAMLKEFATKVKLPGAKGVSTADRWGALPAFQKALESPYNKGSRAWYELEGKDNKLQSDLDYLVFFLRLCRNVLAHHWQQQGLVDILQVMALPDMLGMSAGALAEQVRTCMSKLEPATIEAAATAATAAEGEEERASAGSARSAGSDSSAGIASGSGSAPITRSAGSANGGPNGPDAGPSGVSAGASASSGGSAPSAPSAPSTGSASGPHPRASTHHASASAPSTFAGVSASAPSFGKATSTGSAPDAPSARDPSAHTGPHASAGSPSAPNTGASAPSAGGAGASKKRGGRWRSRYKAKHGSGGAGGGADPASGRGAPGATGGCWPGSSCSKAHTALSSSGAPSAARRCLLAGKAVVRHTRATLPAPVVRRLNLMRVMTTARAAFRLS